MTDLTRFTAFVFVLMAILVGITDVFTPPLVLGDRHIFMPIWCIMWPAVSAWGAGTLAQRFGHTYLGLLAYCLTVIVLSAGIAAGQMIDMRLHPFGCLGPMGLILKCGPQSFALWLRFVGWRVLVFAIPVAVFVVLYRVICWPTRWIIRKYRGT